MKSQLTYGLLVVLMLLSFVVQAQYLVQGTLVDAQQQPVDGATIVSYDADHHLIGYTTSDAAGNFQLKESSAAPSSIEVTHLGYAKYQHSITPQELAGGTAVFDFILSENTKELDDVIIFSYAHKEKDTVLLDLQKLKLHEDTNLKEILKKIPNFKLGNNGSIIYKGKSIDKILVNKKESFTQQNSIALESIENRIIEDISVINNYQNNFEIDFDATTESVLNIDTKTTTKTIKTGSLQGRYGYQDAYEVKAKGLWFGSQLNAFLTQNLNTTGKNTIKVNELQRLVGQQKAVSEYQSTSLKGVFSSDENLKKNFFSSSQLTLRNQGERVKSSTVLYYFAPRRIAETRTNLTTLTDIPLLNNEQRLQTRSNTFLGAVTLDYKATPYAVLSYGAQLNVNKDTNTNSITNELFSPQDTLANRFNTISSLQAQRTTSVYNHVKLSSKLASKLILEVTSGYQLEQGTTDNTYHIQEEGRIQANAIQDFAYHHLVFDASSTVRYKHTDQLLPSFRVSYENTEERITDEGEGIRLTKRNQNVYQLYFEAVGNRVLKQFRYHVSMGLEYAENRTTVSPSVYTTFIPYTASVVYENKMNRITIEAQRRRKVNRLSTGITRIVPFNEIVEGYSALPKTYTEITKYQASYGYNNIFDGKSFSISTSYQRYTDQLQQYLIQLNNGISNTALFLADEVQIYTADAYYSATALQVHYPVKIDVGISYSLANTPTRVGTETIAVDTQSISPALALTTNTEDLVNFKLGSQVSFTTNETPTTTFDAVYTYTALSAMLKNDRWESKLSFIYEHNVINAQTYLRKNINLKLAYTYGKMKFSMEARHLGEVFGFIDNAAYNTRFSIANGINTLTRPNQSLRYIIFGIQYQL